MKYVGFVYFRLLCVLVYKMVSMTQGKQFAYVHVKCPLTNDTQSSHLSPE